MFRAIAKAVDSQSIVMIKIFSLLFIFSFDGNAWWDKGHKIVCDEAYKLLTLEAKKSLIL